MHVYIKHIQQMSLSLTDLLGVKNKDHMGRVVTQKVLFFCPHLLTSVHLLTVPVTVARVGVHTDQRTTRVGLVTRGNCQG